MNTEFEPGTGAAGALGAPSLGGVSEKSKMSFKFELSDGWVVVGELAGITKSGFPKPKET